MHQDALSGQADAQLRVLDLSTHAYNCLRRAGFDTVADVASLSDEQILEIRNIGVKTQKEIRAKLTSYLDEHPLPESRMNRSASGESLSVSEVSSEVIQTPGPDNPPITALRLCTRTHNALRRANIRTIGQLAQMSSKEIRQVRNIGEKSLAEIEENLAAYLAEHPFEELIATLAQLGRPTSEPIASSSDGQISTMDTSISVLELTSRSHNALIRAGIDTVSQLAQMSSGEIGAVRNIGQKSLADIKKNIEAYSSEYTPPEAPPVEPDASVPLIDSALRELAQCAPLNDIAVERIGLTPLSQSTLLQSGITSVGELVCQRRDALNIPPPVKDRLERYLTWLVEQDEAIWADEVAGRGISPVHQMDLAETSLDDFMERWLSSSKHLYDRDRSVISWRYGLYGEGLTLEEAGERLDVTGERVRQLQERALRHLNTPRSRATVWPLVALILHLFEQAHGLISEDAIEDSLRERLRVANVDPCGMAHLLLEITPDVRHARAKAWRLESIPMEDIATTGERLIRILEEELVPLPIAEVIAR